MTRRPPGRGVAVEPLWRVAPRMSVVLVPWGLIILGRRVCLVAQRVPVLVRLVRALDRGRRLPAAQHPSPSRG